MVRFFPAAGRANNQGDVAYRGVNGGYWSSSAGSVTNAWPAYFNNTQIYLGSNQRTWLFSVRCVARGS